jgi:hypothetical protein
MTHPDINLDKITSDLEALGFEAVTRLQFRRDFLEVRVVNGLIPEGLDFLPEAVFQITVYDKESEVLGCWYCPIDSFRVDE